MMNIIVIMMMKIIWSPTEPYGALRSPMQPYRRRSENSRLQTSRRRSEISRLRSVWGDLCKGLTRIPDTNPLHKPLAETLAET